MRSPDVSRPRQPAGQTSPFIDTAGDLVPRLPANVSAARLDPYPERSEPVAGVRQTTDCLAADLELSDEPSWLEPLPFVAASVEPDRRWMRYGWFPLAATILSALAQAVLAATIAVRVVSAVVGIVAAVSILLCSLCLIAAQCVTQTGLDR